MGAQKMPSQVALDYFHFPAMSVIDKSGGANERTVQIHGCNACLNAP